MAKQDERGRSEIITNRLAELGAQGRAASARPVCYLVVEEGPDTGRSYPVAPPGATIGRESPEGIVPNDPRLSRQHARLEVDATGIVVRDLGSTNGTFVNGQRLNAPRRLILGDLLQLGGTALRVADAPGGDAATTRHAPLTTSRLRAATGQMPTVERTEGRDGGLLRTQWHERGASSQPVFELRRGRLYRTPWHELGPSQFPEYELRGSFLYRTAHHERSVSRTPDYELRGGFFYRTNWHASGPSREAEYQLI